MARREGGWRAEVAKPNGGRSFSLPTYKVGLGATAANSLHKPLFAEPGRASRLCSWRLFE